MRKFLFALCAETIPANRFKREFSSAVLLVSVLGAETSQKVKFSCAE